MSAEAQVLTDEEIAHLRTALLASLGVDRGSDAFGEAMLWAAEHPERLSGLDRPLGYLFRVGQSKTRTRRRRDVGFPPVTIPEPWFEPGLPAALGTLTAAQRLAVVLIHGYGMTHREVGELRGWRISTVQRHTQRGMDKLRRELGVTEQ